MDKKKIFAIVLFLIILKNKIKEKLDKNESYEN